MSARDASSHRNNFDGVRLLAALCVVVSHQFAVVGRPEPAAFATTPGTFGVLVFFTVSGFLIASSWQRDPNLPRFALRRFLRIWPALAAVVVLTAAAVFLLDARPEAKAAAVRYLSNLWLGRFDAPIFFPDNPYKVLNGPLWTLPLEVACYGAFVLLTLALGRRTRQGLLLLTLVAVPAFMLMRGPVLLSGSVPAGVAFLPYFGAFFAVGSLFAYVWPSRRVRVGLVLLGIAALALGLTALGIVLLLPLGVLWVGRRSWPVLRSTGRIGDLSYGTYVWAWPVQQVGVVLLGTTLPLPLMLATTLVVTLSLAFLSWHVVEQPALRWKPRSRSPDTAVASARLDAEAGRG